jgi:hypothetical protein
MIVIGTDVMKIKGKASDSTVNIDQCQRVYQGSGCDAFNMAYDRDDDRTMGSDVATTHTYIPRHILQNGKRDQRGK